MHLKKHLKIDFHVQVRSTWHLAWFSRTTTNTDKTWFPFSRLKFMFCGFWIHLSSENWYPKVFQCGQLNDSIFKKFCSIFHIQIFRFSLFSFHFTFHMIWQVKTGEKPAPTTTTYLVWFRICCHEVLSFFLSPVNNYNLKSENEWNFHFSLPI